jgi:hypothetical protein
VAHVCTRVAAALIASMTMAGCHVFDSDEKKIDRWGGILSDLRYQWDAQPGIDVTTGAAVPVRAYIESRVLATAMGDLEFAYPGFAEAVAPDGDPNLRPNINHPRQDPLVGNSRYHFLSMDRTGATVIATLCSYDYTVAEEDGGQYRSVAAGTNQPQGIDAVRVTLRAPADGSSTLPPQSGPSPAPSDNVFGGWRITDYEFSTRDGFRTRWPAYDEVVAKCVDSAPDPPDRREALVNGEHPRSDFPTSPPAPGWPSPAK